ncbi:Hypothetical predicted protein [Mytilus galloprovincialis]|uniref:Reverse transcriptase domain-containing protein n=1 Tax=Mytilus galloprovincialis TaxID=29158 RepID=A0A8B6HC06_MYTGA|nr:Hypothetical predicted protein [Mytilus galloprovincialis]
MYHRNKRSARQNTEFVAKSIEDLVLIGCVIKVPFQPYVVNPLSVATQKSGKKRLILDMSQLNKHIKREKIKFEDWKLAIQYFDKDMYLFKFDLKSGYFHLDICSQQQTFLGFQWEGQFYCYTVLAFGITTGPYIFTKCLRPLVKFWRGNGIKVVLYLDDGFGMSPDENTCNEQSSFVKRSLIDAGFLINEEKSVFKPVIELEWLGIVWNFKEYKLSITQRRVDDLISSLNVILAKFPYVTARSLAQVVGRIISMTPVIGNVARIMSKFCYMEIESRIGWDIPITGYKPVEVLSELKFWLENVTMINYRNLCHYSKSSVVIYSDASNIAAGAYTVELENKIFHKMWTCSETVQSSTWRELKAIEKENEKADYISKMVDFEDWGVTHIFFNFLNDMWGPYSIDRFASVENRKVMRFNSLFWQPDSEAVDAFSQVWTNENNWLVPPINLVIRSIKHIIACKARGTLVVPKWTSAAFWPLIFDKHLIYQDYVKDVIVFKKN